jgi:hypothetical protein
MDDIGPAGIAANIEHFEAVRIKYTELALDALVEEIKWRFQQEMKKNPENALKTLLTTSVD